MSHSHGGPFGSDRSERDPLPESPRGAAPSSTPTKRSSIHELGGEIQFVLSTGQLTRTLYTIVGVLTAIQIVVLVWRLGFHGEGLTRLTTFFTLDAENNIPSFFSASLLLLASLLCAIAGGLDARLGGRNQLSMHGYWYMLAGVFTFLAVDEACQVHEFIGHVIRSLWTNRGLMQWPWAIPYLLFAGIVGFRCIPFLRSLPPAIMRRCFVAGVVYVTGAAGFDMIEGLISAAIRSGAEQLRTLSLCMPVIEEPLEMIGVILFISAVLSYLENRAPVLRARVTR